MLRRSAIVGLLALAGGKSYAGQPKPNFRVGSITFYLPTSFFEARAATKPLADYILALETSVSRVFKAWGAGTGVSGSLLVMVKPGQRSRAWIVVGKPGLPAGYAESIKKALEVVPPMTVRGGPLLFGVAFSAWGGGQLPQPQPYPIPDDWYGKLDPKLGIIDDAFLSRVWPS